jgi:hypothetical protein
MPYENSLRRFHAKVGMEDIFKPTAVNKFIYKISNINGVRTVNVTTSKKTRFSEV